VLRQSIIQNLLSISFTPAVVSVSATEDDGVVEEFSEPFPHTGFLRWRDRLAKVIRNRTRVLVAGFVQIVHDSVEICSFPRLLPNDLNLFPGPRAVLTHYRDDVGGTLVNIETERLVSLLGVVEFRTHRKLRNTVLKV
jgi:hypothetical protein